jgi:hypothetical protein
MGPLAPSAHFSTSSLKKETEMVQTAKISGDPKKDTPLPDLSAAQSNAPNREETLFAVGQLKSMAQEKSDLAKKHKGIRNGLKLQGHVLKDIEHNIEIEKQLDDTELATLKNRARIAQFMGMPIGSQVSFNDILNGSAPSQTDVMKAAYDKGYELAIKGAFVDDQAYPPMTQEGAQHRSGWDDGQKVHQEKFIKLNETIRNAELARAVKKKKDDESLDDEVELDDEPIKDEESKPASTMN